MARPRADWPERSSSYPPGSVFILMEGCTQIERWRNDVCHVQESSATRSGSRLDVGVVVVLVLVDTPQALL